MSLNCHKIVSSKRGGRGKAILVRVSIFAAGFEKIGRTLHDAFVSRVRGDQVSSTVIRARTSKMALEREREREKNASENERGEEKESRAGDRPIHEEDTKVSVTSV